jgi:hypothetical protein
MFNCRSALSAIHNLAIASVVLVPTLLCVSSSPPAASAASVVVPSCEGSSLVGAFVSNQVGMGHIVTTIAITNVGTASCELGGYPNLVGLRGKKEFKLHVTAHGTYGGDLRPTTLAPRMSGALIIGTGDLCAPSYGVPVAGHSYSGLIVVLPQNRGAVPVPGVTVDTTCYLVESQLGWRRNFSIQGV